MIVTRAGVAKEWAVRRRGPAAGYGTTEVAGWLGLPAATLRSWARSGLLAAERRDGRYRFTFEDLAVLRAARRLLVAGLAPRRVKGVLAALHDRLPEGRSLSGVRLELVDGAVVARDEGLRWEVGSGQRLLDLERDGSEPTAVVEPLHHPGPDAGEGAEARAEESTAALFTRACELDFDHPERASRLYEAVLARDPDHPDAHCNLGRLLHEGGRLELAETHYRAALAARPDDATAHYNLGVALEDRGDAAAAEAAYRRALELDPESADAHFNLAGVLERAGRGRDAIRHLKAYRALARRG